MQYVRYIGAAHRRVITSGEWRSAKLKGDQVVWEAQNGFAVPLDMFSEDQIKRAIEPDPDLVITGEDEEFEPAYSPVDMTPRELIQSVENPIDVVGVLNGDVPAPTGISGPSVGLRDAPSGNVRDNEERIDLGEDPSTLNRDEQD